jgi:hypothetical protein
LTSESTQTLGDFFQSSSNYFPAHNFSVPIDHFHDSDEYAPHTNETFSLRYWFDATYYKPSGPVFLLAAGETYGDERLPFLQKGIINQLSKATNGLGVILEHRYYGTSFPVPNLSVSNLRFLTTEQALADTKYFAENIMFPGLENYDLTSKNTAWIAYGGSYAGAFVAFLRVLYPGTFFGAISSSGVTKAIVDYWEYFEPIRLFGPSDCIGFTQDLVELVDNILLDSKKRHLAKTLKEAFGFPGITHNADFAATLTAYGIGGWQSRNWDPEISDPSFERYCSNVTDGTVLYPDTEDLRSTISKLVEEAEMVVPPKPLVNQLLNFVGWANVSLVQPCKASSASQDACFGTFDNAIYQRVGLEQQGWRSWTYQVCTQWGYFYTSDVPDGIRPLQSRLLDMAYSSKICEQAFNITKLPNVEAINQFGGFDIEYDRLAIIDGRADPWRYATPHAPSARKRNSTINKPFIEMEGAIHHWDENGRFPNETTPDLPPGPVREAQEQIIHAVKHWVKGNRA